MTASITFNKKTMHIDHDCFKQHEGIDTQYSIGPIKLRRLYELTKEYAETHDRPVMLEVGICHGYTGTVLACIAGHVDGEYWTIDNFSLGSTEAEIHELFVKRNLQLNLITGYSHDIPWDKPLDILFIDGCHAPDEVKYDCETYVPHVKPGGLVFFDDWVSDDDLPDSNAHGGIAYYGRKATEGWEDLGHCEGMRIFRRPL